jgi:hypothetical protein
MKRTKWLILILVCLAAYFAGDYLMSIYGMDPPYIYYYSGFALEIVSTVVGIFAMVFLVINLVKKKR